MKYIDVVGKNIEEAIKQGLIELNTTEDNVEVTVLKQAGMFSKAKVRLTLINETQPIVEEKEHLSLTDIEKKLNEEKLVEEKLNEENKSNEEQNKEEIEENANPQVEANQSTEITTLAGKVLVDICAQISSNITIKETQKERVIVYEISGEGSDKLIGKGGQALEGLQLILNSINRHKEPQKPDVVVRIAEYEKMKESKLQKIAIDSANKAIEINNTVRLQTMNSYERRIVHAFLQQDDRVETESFGVEPYRYITVRPKVKKED